VAATIPNCKAWDPAHAGELAVIIDAGMREMLTEQRDVFYYITLMNEPYPQPDLAESDQAGVLRGGYVLARHGDNAARNAVTLLASGAILPEALKAAETLSAQGIAASVISITSWSELARDAQACMQSDEPERAWIAQLLAATNGPIIAASDYVRAVPEAIRAFIPAGRDYRTLGTDGFGRSDTRAALGRFFGVDAQSIARVAMSAV